MRYNQGKMRVVLICLVVLLWLAPWGSGMEYRGWQRYKLTWDRADDRFTFAGVLHLKTQWTSTTDTISDLYLDEGGFDRWKIRARYTRSSYRVKCGLSLAAEGFDWGSGALNLSQDPWDLAWEAKLDPAAGLTWKLDASLRPEEGPKWEIIAHFADLLNFSSGVGKLWWTTRGGGETKLSFTVDPHAVPTIVPQLRWEGPFLTGTGTIELTGARVTALGCTHQWELPNETRELRLDWDQDTGWEYGYADSVSFGVGRTGRISAAAQAGPPLQFTSLAGRLDWGVWEVALDFIAQEVDLSLSQDLAADLYLELDAYCEPDGQEIEAYLEGDTFYLDLTLSLSMGTLDQLKITLKFYF